MGIICNSEKLNDLNENTMETLDEILKSKGLISNELEGNKIILDGVSDMLISQLNSNFRLRVFIKRNKHFIEYFKKLPEEEKDLYFWKEYDLTDTITFDSVTFIFSKSEGDVWVRILNNPDKTKLRLGKTIEVTNRCQDIPRPYDIMLEVVSVSTLDKNDKNDKNDKKKK